MRFKHCCCISVRKGVILSCNHVHLRQPGSLLFIFYDYFLNYFFTLSLLARYSLFSKLFLHLKSIGKIQKDGISNILKNSEIRPWIINFLSLRFNCILTFFNTAYLKMQVLSKNGAVRFYNSQLSMKVCKRMYYFFNFFFYCFTFFLKKIVTYLSSKRT